MSEPRANTFIKVTAHLASPMAGEPPMLDSILEWVMAGLEGKLISPRRDQPCPPFGEIHLPMACRDFEQEDQWGEIHAVKVACCSSPIISVKSEVVEHLAKRLGVEHSALLEERRRVKVAMGNSAYKSYRLPLRSRLIDRVSWFAVAKQEPIKKALRHVPSLGKKRSYGYARVARWEVEWVDEDYSLFAPWEDKMVLMRPLPFCEGLPGNLIGCRRDFGACQPPYFHPDRYREIVTPC